ncbi:hypothetical protein RBSWK_05680 [Rhodopirellula baltica SWK14]|uniref:Uncharacterized protein n=1 Tax=Rhodopirellula baltica SWK14 TaxID=993516 RepID=L7C8P1_RHOBT|nr:hypothetical protein RBSWK_05680 [Rhodopirellula baltica SWK14]
MMNGFPAVELKQATQRNLGHPTFVRHEERRADGGSAEGILSGLVAAICGHE